MYECKKEKGRWYGRVGDWVLGGGLCLVGDRGYGDCGYKMESVWESGWLMVWEENRGSI